MKNYRYILILLFLLVFNKLIFTQTENVPAHHPVYQFLKRMEIKKLISEYHDAIIPISRKKVAMYLQEIEKSKAELTDVENNILNDFNIEFQFDIKYSASDSYFLIEPGGDLLIEKEKTEFFNNEKHVFGYSDDIINLFLDGLLTVDFRRSTGDSIKDNTQYFEGGFRLRGSVHENFGFYLKLTNAQFWGSRNVLVRDKRIKQSFALSTIDSKNFDFVEGYARYDVGIISAQVGRERVLWGNSYGTKMFLSEYPRVFDAIRFDGEYKKFKYTFLHAWILGKPNFITIDNGLGFEPVVADKYFAAHRLEYSFGRFLDIGIQEITIYSNRSVDLGYLNPFTFFESVQRSREERDNGFLAFDFQLKPFKGYELQGTMFFDDIHIPKWGTNRWENKYVYQIGILAVDPIGIPNTNFAIEYTRAEPFMFSHDRSRENEYSSNNVLLGTQINPNSESWFFKIQHFISHRFNISASLEMQRHGKNVYDEDGNLITNVGGDFLVPHRPTDASYKDFLGGNLHKIYLGKIFASYEIINEIIFDLWYDWTLTKNIVLDNRNEYHDFGGTLRIDF